MKIWLLLATSSSFPLPYPPLPSLPPNLLFLLFSLFLLSFPFPPVLSFSSCSSLLFFLFPLPFLPLFWCPIKWERSKYFLYFLNIMVVLLDSHFDCWAGGRPSTWEEEWVCVCVCVCVWGAGRGRHTHACLGAEKGPALAILPREWDVEGRPLSSSGAKQLRTIAWSQAAGQEWPNSFVFQSWNLGTKGLWKLKCSVWLDLWVKPISLGP